MLGVSNKQVIVDSFTGNFYVYGYLGSFGEEGLAREHVVRLSEPIKKGGLYLARWKSKDLWSKTYRQKNDPS